MTVDKKDVALAFMHTMNGTWPGKRIGPLCFVRCWTGRRWVHCGGTGVGFGPDRLIERVYWRGRLVYPRVSP